MATKTAIVFSGRNGLDFSELRANVLRIPDVTIRIRQAQTILDSIIHPTDLPKVDLMNVVAADDEAFFKNIKMKSLVSAVVQVGLYDRFCRTQKRPDFMIGNINGDSAMMVCSGRISFEEMVRTSQAVDTLRPAQNDVVVPISAALPAPLLSGLSLTEFGALQSTQSEEGLSYSSVATNAMDIKKVVETLAAEHGVERYINIGPAAAMRTSDYKSVGEDIESIDSIELDPMLGWFWRGIRQQSLAIAQ